MPRCEGAAARSRTRSCRAIPAAIRIKIAEIFRGLSDGIFTELAAPAEGSSPYAISTIRRNLQREYIKRLSTMVLGPKNDQTLGGYRYVIFYGMAAQPPPDAKNLARLHLSEIGEKIDKLLGRQELKIDDTTLAHLKEIRFRIDKVLKANLNANEP